MPRGRQATPPKIVTDVGTGVGGPAGKRRGRTSAAVEVASEAAAFDAPTYDPGSPPAPAPAPAPAAVAPAPAAAAPRARTSSLPPMPMDEVGDLARHVRVGLIRRPRVLPSRWMFDEIGTALYDAWTHLPENGIARAELRLLERNAARVADAVPGTGVVVELGPANGRRKRQLLDALARRGPLTYTSIEVSEATLRRNQRDLADVPGVHVTGFEGGIADIAATLAVHRSSQPGRGNALVMWLGAGLGALDLVNAEQTLGAIRLQLRPGDALLLGTDLLKHESLLIKAYDDPAGVVAAFTRAYLGRINRELGGELDLRTFEHAARWNAEARRIELHLVARTPVHARINAAGIVVHMEPGESIWTASAHKLLPHEPGALGARTGFAAAAQWLDPTWPYAATLLIAQ